MSYWAVGLLVEVTEVAHMLEYFGKWRMQRECVYGCLCLLPYVSRRTTRHNTYIGDILLFVSI